MVRAVSSFLLLTLLLSNVLLLSNISLSQAQFKGKIYIIGGTDSSGSLSRVEVYDPKTDSWKECKLIPSQKLTCEAGAINCYFDYVKIFEGSAYSGYLSDLNALYNPTTQIMEYSWKINVINGLGMWKTRYYLFYTLAEYVKNVTNVPSSWTESSRETISPGREYQWKVELYDPGGNLVDVKLASASSIISANTTSCSVTFKTNPTSGGVSITFSGTTYTNGQTASYSSGDYTANANAPSGYAFHHWEYSGSSGSGVYVPNINVNPTTVQVRGDGWLKAAFSAQIVFYTNPSNVGSIQYDSSTYTNGQMRWEPNLPPDYTNQVHIIANVPPGYTFSGWTTTGGLSVNNPSSSDTLLTVNGPGTLTASFQQATTPSLSVQVSANPNSITTSQTSTIIVTVTSGGSAISGASVSLSCSPSGPSLNPSSGTTSSDGKFTATFSSSTPGTFTITATASKLGYNSGSGSTQVTVSQTPPPLDFSLSANPNNLSITLPSSGTASAASTIEVASINGFSSQVSLSASWVNNAPSGVTYSFSKNSVTPPSNGRDSSILTITVSSSASTGSFTLRVTGTSGSLTHYTDITVTISPSQQKYLMVSVSAASYQLNSEESTTIRATVTTSDGGSPSITYSWSANGGALSSTSGNPVIWTAPRVTSQTTYRITVSVSASGYTGASGYVDITVNPKIQRGTLVVYIYNVNDKLANYMSGKTYAYLTGDGGTFSATMNSQGYATFSDIPVGTYKLSVFHKPQETGALNLDEYWGTENVQVNEGYNEKKFVRSAPWVTDYSVKVGGKEIARLGFMGQEAIDIGSTVDFQISVKNSGSSSVNTRVRLIIDANRISPFDYDQTSSWKTTSPGSTAIHQFTVSFVAGSQFHEIAPTYSAYIIVISKYDDKEYVTDQYIWTEFVSFKIQFSSEKANIIMKLASEIIDIVLKQDKVIVEETLRKIVQGKTVGDVSITISPDMIEKVSGRTGLVSGIAIPFTFKTAELAFIVLDKDMSYEKKLDALAEVVAKISVATATRIALHLAIKGMVTAAAITVPVPPASLTFTGAATVAALITYLGEGFISDAVADYVVSKNWGDIKGKARSFLEGFKESLFPILNKNAVSISAHCPIYISVRDTRGRITGMIFSNGRYSILEEIPGSKFFNESGHQTVWIAFPESGNYGIAVNGSDQGEYTIMVTSFVDSEVYRNETISGKIEKGEMNVLSIKLDDGVTPKIGPMIRSIFIDTTVAIGDPLTISLEVSGKGVIEVSAILRDSNNVSRSSILMKQGSIYRASLDTSGMEKGAAVLTLVAKDSNLSTAASFIVMLLGRMQIKIQQYKSEVSSGERLELKLLLTDHNDNPVDSANVHIILAGNNYVAQNTARGLYSAVLDTNQLEGSYTVYINASKPLYRSTETSLALMVRPWWWPYLPYSAIAFVAVILMIGYAVYRSRRREMIIIGSEDLLKVLKEASERLSKGDYAEAVKYSAETLRSRLLEKLGLSGSLTIDELVDEVVKLRKDIDSEKLRYVLKKGEECTFARYKPNREEAEKVLKYSEELLSKL